MTDTQEQSVADPEGTNEAVATEAEPKAQKVVKQPHACYCSKFEVGDYSDGKEDEVFTTGCVQTTQGTFAQGHDARLVSFLVDGHFDGYTIRLVEHGAATRTFSNPGEAARTASEALGDKAAKATINRQAKEEAKKKRLADRESAKAEKLAAKKKAAADKAAAKEKAAAEKASKPKTTGAEVVAGSAEGDGLPVTDGMTTIKVGRWEYRAQIDEETGEATYVDGKGEQVTVERDGYRLLQDA